MFFRSGESFLSVELSSWSQTEIEAIGPYATLCDRPKKIVANHTSSGTSPLAFERKVDPGSHPGS